MTLALSTMWAQQDRFVADMHLFVDEVLALGYDAIEISHLTPQVPFDRLLSREGVRITSIHAPAPLVRNPNDRSNSSLNLAALDDAERRAAIDYTKASIDLTKQAGGRYVVVHLGGVGNKMYDAELQLRRLFDSGTREGNEVEALRAAIIERRGKEQAPWLEKARETLRELVAYASDRGIAVGIENRLHYHEIPQPNEAAELLREYAPDAAGYWHDVGHAEVQARLGLVDKRRWLDVNGPRTIGSHLHDVDGIGDHRAPGAGDVEWAYIRDGLPASALRVFEINQGQSPESVRNAIPFLRDRGVIA
jgi:sugar phosphate isomerase/epimerase